MDVPNGCAIARSLPLFAIRLMPRTVSSACIEVIRIIDPPCLSTMTNDLLGENIMKKTKTRVN